MPYSASGTKPDPMMARDVSQGLVILQSCHDGQRLRHSNVAEGLSSIGRNGFLATRCLVLPDVGPLMNSHAVIYLHCIPRV